MIVAFKTLLEPPRQFGEIAKGILFGSVGRWGWAAHESTGQSMKRAERIVPLKAAALFRCGAARVLAHVHRSASSSGGGGSSAKSGCPEQAALVMKRPVAQAFQPAGSRNFPVPWASLPGLPNWEPE